MDGVSSLFAVGKTILRSCSYAIVQLCDHAVVQLCNFAIMQFCDYAILQRHRVFVKMRLQYILERKLEG